MRNGAVGPVLLAGVLTVLVMEPLAGAPRQESEIAVEVGGSSVKPPEGVDGETARFLVAGLRASRFGLTGSGISASFLAGRSLEEGAGGDFLSGTLQGTAWRGIGSGFSAGLEARGFGFRVVEPFPYQSAGLEGGPGLRFSSGFLSAEVQGILGAGWSRTELVRYAGNRGVTEVEDNLWRYGANAELLAGTESLMGGFSLGVHETPGGTYRSGGVQLLATRNGSAVELRLDAWHTPTGREATGGIALIIPLGGWSLRGFLGKTEPDPLTLAESGGGSGGLLLGRRLWGRDALPSPPPPLHRVLEKSGGTALVRFSIPAPEGARELEILGDFTRWEPVAMEPDGDRWVVEMEIRAGAYHFGFQVDGEWYLPDNAPDAVPDEWGRKNSTLVIEQ